jgi:lysophospholipase L1-like esterase
MIVGDSILKNIRNIYDCHIFSLSGASLNEISTKFDEAIFHCPEAKTVLIHGGTNDLINQDVTSMIAKYEALIEKIHSNHPNISLQISCILPRPRDDASIDMKRKRVNHLLRDLCVKKRCFYVASDKVFYKSGKLINELFTDGLHLNMTGTKRLRQFFCQRLSELGAKPTNPFCHAHYMRRNEWQNSDLKLIGT